MIRTANVLPSSTVCPAGETLRDAELAPAVLNIANEAMTSRNIGVTNFIMRFLQRAGDPRTMARDPARNDLQQGTRRTSIA
jgi:hypothetical protein